MSRQEFATRKIYLVSPSQVETVLALAKNIPLDHENPVEVVFREKQKVRKPDANARMWAGPLRDIAEQAWVSGKQFSAEVWHEFFKREYLPEDDDPEIEKLAKEGYQKWSIDPAGTRVLIGSTTQLLTYGFAQYLQKVEAHGASLGVRYMERAWR